MKISIVLNTFNASKFLKKTLEAVKEYDDIVVCDMHSTDDTVAIAQSFNARIVLHENTGYVEPARNFAIGQARHEWVLMLDADEIVSDDLKDFLSQIVQEDRFSGVEIPFKNYFMSQWMRSAYPDYHLRFFKKKNAYWPPEIHSKLKLSGEVYKIPKNRTDLAIDHIANDSVTQILNKNNIYSTAEIERRGGKKITVFKIFFSPFLWFLKFFFIKKAFLDGPRGFIFSCLKAQYKFATLAKIYEHQKF